MKQSSKKTSGPGAKPAKKVVLKQEPGLKSFSPRFTGTQTRSGTFRQGKY